MTTLLTTLLLALGLTEDTNLLFRSNSIIIEDTVGL